MVECSYRADGVLNGVCKVLVGLFFVDSVGFSVDCSPRSFLVLARPIGRRIDTS